MQQKSDCNPFIRGDNIKPQLLKSNNETSMDPYNDRDAAAANLELRALDR